MVPKSVKGSFFEGDKNSPSEISMIHDFGCNKERPVSYVFVLKFLGYHFCDRRKFLLPVSDRLGQSIYLYIFGISDVSQVTPRVFLINYFLWHFLKKLCLVR